MPVPALFDAAADTYDEDPHHLVIARRLVAGLHPVPEPGLVVDVATGTGFAALPADLAVPADEAGAARIARAAGFAAVRVTTTAPPRRSFLVFAEVPR